MQAIILCGGRGERLKPLTNDVPKPLVNINNKPIIEHIIEHLHRHKIKEIILAAGYKADKFHKFVSSYDSKTSLEVIDSGDCDILDRIKSCKAKINEKFLVLYGDTISDINILELEKYHDSNESSGTITIWPLKTHFGLVEFNKKNKVTSFIEKPTLNKWINIGYFMFEKDIFNKMKLYNNWENFLIKGSKESFFSVYKHGGIHLTINNLQELHHAEEEIKKFGIN